MEVYLYSSVDTDGESSLRTPCQIELLPGHFTMIYNPELV